MQTIADVREAIKPLGYSVSTKRSSWGSCATYSHVETGEKLNGNVFTIESREKWIVLFNWRESNREALKAVRQNENCTGLL